jgi:hypothetical protein
MLARAVQTFANDLHQISDAIKGRTVTQIKGTLQKKAFDEAGIVIQQQVQVSERSGVYNQERVIMAHTRLALTKRFTNLTHSGL